MSRFAARPPSRWGLILAGVLLVFPLLLSLGITLGLGMAQADVDYVVDAAGLHVHGGLGPLRDERDVPRANLGPAREVTLGAGLVRTRGTGTGRYCGGAWRDDTLGPFWGAWNCSREVVAVEAQGETIVVAPADRAAFLAALANLAGTYAGGAAPAPALATGGLGVLALPVLGCTLVGLLFARMLRPMVYVVEGGTLTVPAFFRPVSVDLAGAEAGWGKGKATFRLAGGALPGAVYLGLFRGGGETFHAAATTLAAGWLVRGNRRVFVTPADDAAFAEALRDAGTRITTEPPG
jgi:hypothetical protein